MSVICGLQDESADKHESQANARLRGTQRKALSRHVSAQLLSVGHRAFAALYAQATWRAWRRNRAVSLYVKQVRQGVGACIRGEVRTLDSKSASSPTHTHPNAPACQAGILCSARLLRRLDPEQAKDTAAQA